MLTTWHRSKNLELWFRAVVHVDKPADHCVQQNYKDCSQGRDEEYLLLVGWVFLGRPVTRNSDGVEHDEGTHPHRGVKLRRRKVLECVDDDTVRWVSGGPRLRERFTQQCWSLADQNVDGGACHVCRQRHERDHVDDPADANKADEKGDRTAEDGQRRCDLIFLDALGRKLIF